MKSNQMEKAKALPFFCESIDRHVLIPVCSNDSTVYPSSPRKLPRPVVTITIVIIDIFLIMISYAFKGATEEYSVRLSVRMGAKYAPCMKPLDSELEQKIYEVPLKMCCHSLFFPYQFYRFITPIFLHDNFTHLVSNLIYQILAGCLIEEKYGRKTVALSYILSGTSGNILSVLHNPQTASVGASGAIYGLLVFCIVDTVLSIFTIHDIQDRIIQSFLTLLIIPYFVLSLFVDVDSSGHIDHAAHIGGALMGCFVALFVCEMPKFVHYSVPDSEIFIRLFALTSIIVYFFITLSAFYLFTPVKLKL